ncbi:MAG: amino acid ABC transporter substrate-binding protein [Nocardioidaceae bacterium]|nr:amino acid ABC transporter substrate-binding protein [Nocardioidaceae bacterium]
MTKTNVFKALALASALGLALTACGSSDDGDKKGSAGSGSDLGLIKSGTLTVCSDVPYPPFEDFDKSAPSGFKGFDVDVISAVADDLKVKVAIKDSSFDALKSGLAIKAKQCDLVASAMTITDERKKVMALSEPYYDSKQSLLVPAGSSIKAIGDLDGKKVGVQKGTTGESYARENAKGAKLVVFPSDGEMYTAIKGGTVDALLQDLPVNLDHQKDPKQPGKFTIVEQYDTDESYGFAMNQDDKNLVDAVDKALQGLRDSGKYQTIYDKYFS